VFEQTISFAYDFGPPFGGGRRWRLRLGILSLSARALPCGVFFVGLLLIVGAEIAAFVAVAEQIGFLWALLILIVVSALGPLIVRHVGLGVLAQTRERLTRGELPTRELLDGLVVFLAGVMICVPGFIGDGLGLLLMIGPVRHLVIRVSGQRLARRVQTFPTGRWRVIDVGFRPTGEDAARPPFPPREPLDGPPDLPGD
jgi:UPF0716 protein FxsA